MRGSRRLQALGLLIDARSISKPNSSTCNTEQAPTMLNVPCWIVRHLRVRPDRQSYAAATPELTMAAAGTALASTIFSKGLNNTYARKMPNPEACGIAARLEMLAKCGIWLKPHSSEGKSEPAWSALCRSQCHTSCDQLCHDGIVSFLHYLKRIENCLLLSFLRARGLSED